jgi:hypothetical protein
MIILSDSQFYVPIIRKKIYPKKGCLSLYQYISKFSKKELNIFIA